MNEREINEANNYHQVLLHLNQIHHCLLCPSQWKDPRKPL